jgi:hypothetical protein
VSPEYPAGKYRLFLQGIDVRSGHVLPLTAPVDPVMRKSCVARKTEREKENFSYKEG